MKILQFINTLQLGDGASKLCYDLSLSLISDSDVEVSLLNLVEPQDKTLVNNFKKKGIKCFTLSNKIYSIKNICKLKRFLKNNRFDVIHVHLFPPLYYVAIVKLLCRKSIKIVYTEHSTKNRRRNSFLFTLLDRIIYKQYNSVVAISERVKYLLDEHLKNDKSIIIHNGINIHEIECILPINIKSLLNLPNDSVIVTMVARFVVGKDYKTLIKSLLYLPINVHVVCVGDGPLLKETKLFANKCNLNKRTHFLGLRSDVVEILKSSDIIVLSSEHEGFSISMLEGMSCKKPFIASNVEGLKDLVSNTAMMFEFQNEKMLAEKINSFLNDKSLYTVVANKCFDFAQKYDINNIKQLYLREYK